MAGKKTLTWMLWSFLGLLPVALPGQERFDLTSPDQSLTLSVSLDRSLALSVEHRGQPLLRPSVQWLNLERSPLIGIEDAVEKVDRGEVQDSVLRPYQSTAHWPEHYRWLRLSLRSGAQFEARAYDQGVAWRWILDAGADSLRVLDEGLNLALPSGEEMQIVGETLDADQPFFFYDQPYTQSAFGAIDPGTHWALPLLMDFPGPVQSIFTEIGGQPYAGLSLRRVNSRRPQFEGWLSRYVTRARALPLDQGGGMAPLERVDWIARIQGRTVLPWRVMLVVTQDRALLDHPLPYLLSPPLDSTEGTDFSWVKPGKIFDDTWNGFNLKGVNFQAGINASTYRFLIDVAADHHIEYVQLGPGWFDAEDWTQARIEVADLADYARQRGVGLFLWLPAQAIAAAPEAFMAQCQAWGIAGLKLDAWGREDQAMLTLQQRMVRLAAQYRLMLVLHGSGKPPGWERRYPHVLSYKAVRGAEHDKRGGVSPTYALQVPFLRNLQGPMDYGLGALRDVQPANFYPRANRPTSQGTRCHHLARYVVYYSPLQSLVDAATDYLAEPSVLDLIGQIPTTWQACHAIGGQIGEWAALARQQGETWYLGVMSSNAKKRRVHLPLDFLAEGEWQVELWQDGPNAHRYAEDYRKSVELIGPGDTLHLTLAPHGGAIGVMRRR